MGSLNWSEQESGGSLFSLFLFKFFLELRSTNSRPFPMAQIVKDSPATQEMQETWVRSLGWKDTLEEGMQPTSVFLPGEFHGQRSLEGSNPWGCTESDTTEVTEQSAALFLQVEKSYCSEFP